jgi:hypothetical protein
MMQKCKKHLVFLRISGGFIAFTSGFVLICLLNWESSVDLPVNLCASLAGISLSIVGIRLLLMATADGGPPVQVNGAELGRIQLNGYYLIAYESEGANAKKQFRLRSYRTLSPEKEAALVRYLAVEGFLVSLWPEMKERIEEEANWAFLV